MNRPTITILTACVLALLAGAAPGQQADADDKPAMVKLNLPENVTLKVLIEYVSQTRQINFLYDERRIGQQVVTLKAPAPIPVGAVMPLFESVLKMNNLALAPSGIEGVLKIEQAANLPKIAVGPGEEAGAGAVAVTRIITLEHAEPQQVNQVINAFTSAQSASIVALAEHDMLIVTDYADNMDRLERMIKLIDRPGKAMETKFVPVEHIDSDNATKKLTALMQGRRQAQGAGAQQLTIVNEDRTNQVVLIGTSGQVAEAVAVLRALDVSLDMPTRVYRFEHVRADRVDEILVKVLGELKAKRSYSASIDDEGNLLIASATPGVHEQIEALAASLDKPRPEAQSPIRFYKLENAKAADVLATLQTIEGDQGLDAASVDGVDADQPSPIAYRGPSAEQVNRDGADLSQLDRAVGGGAVDLPDARIMADEPSNTIIVIAAPTMQAMYEKLIRRLDIRRPQVLVEATVVVIDTTDGFRLGVEISNTTNEDGDPTVLNFSSFGLSDVDASTGRLTLSPGIGFNGALISADIADIIIRALQTDSRARIVSRPSVLVNDNATGELVSFDEEPFATTTASGVAGATTSFGGFAEAGTTIRVTPQISEGEHLKLEYTVELSSFSAATEELDADAASLPPARQTNTLTSEATIPDGHTIIVGGLSRDSFSESIDRVPILGSIPGLEYLFSNRTRTQSQSTIFVFLRAVVLRDDKFRYLKYLSDDAAMRAELPGDYPASEPKLIR